MSDESNHLVQSWLELQCQMIAGLTRAAVLFSSGGNSLFSPVATWPELKPVTPALSNAAASALQRGSTVIRDLATAPVAAAQTGDIVAVPIVRNGRVDGAVVVEVTARDADKRQLIAESMNAGTAWLDLLISDRSSASEGRLLSIVEIIAATVEHDVFQAAATTFVTHLAARLRCERVSLGMFRNRQVSVEAISRNASVDRRTNLVTAIGAAMEEAIDQDATVIYPSFTENSFQISRAHSELSEQHRVGSICTVPLIRHREVIGAITLEHAAADRFDEEVVAFCETIAGIAGPLLDDRRKQTQWLGGRLTQETRSLAQKLFGSGHLFLKTVSSSALALVVLSVFATAQYRVTADATLEGTIQRAVIAPFDGYISESNVRPGDIVTKGQILAALDDKDLTLQRLTLASDKSQLDKEYREAMAAHESAQVAILRAQLDKASAQLMLVEEHLARTQVVAPIDGVVIEGDLSQSLGAPVERGDGLFEIAPLDSYRVMLEVDETQVGVLQPGQAGRLALAGFPSDYLSFEVERITPISTVTDGRNVFTIEASLQNTPERLRPGMRGVGKVDIGSRRLAWIWTHRFVDWYQLWSWSWASWA